MFEVIAGAILSIIITIFYDVVRGQWQKGTRYKQIKGQVIDNLHLLDRMVRQFNSPAPSVFPDYQLDLTVLDFLISHGPSSFTTHKEFEDFNKLRYQMHHINSELLFLFDVYWDIPQDYRERVLNHIKGEITNGCKLVGIPNPLNHS
jgi:hypothetical protein